MEVLQAHPGVQGEGMHPIAKLQIIGRCSFKETKDVFRTYKSTKSEIRFRRFLKTIDWGYPFKIRFKHNKAIRVEGVNGIKRVYPDT